MKIDYTYWGWMITSAVSIGLGYKTGFDTFVLLGAIFLVGATILGRIGND